MADTNGPFLGVEALEAGIVRKHELRSKYVALFPGVYVPRGEAAPTFLQRAQAAWLWSHRRGVLCGLTASRLHGAKWIDDDSPVELMWSNGRPPPGIRVHKGYLADNERGLKAGLPVTTVPRTAYDLGRRGRRWEAVERLDALRNVTRFAVADVNAVAREHPGARGLRQLGEALDLCDPARSRRGRPGFGCWYWTPAFPDPRPRSPSWWAAAQSTTSTWVGLS